MSDKSRIEQNNTDINNLKGLLDSSASVVESLPNSSICDVAPEDIVYGKKAIGLTGNVTGTLEIINTNGTLYGTGTRFDAPSGKAMSSINVSLDSETIDNLLPENIKSGITLCGITGDYGGGSEGDTGYHVWEFASQNDMNSAFSNGTPLVNGDYGIYYQSSLQSSSWANFLMGSGPYNCSSMQFPDTISTSDWYYQTNMTFDPSYMPFRVTHAPFTISSGYIGIDPVGGNDYIFEMPMVCTYYPSNGLTYTLYVSYAFDGTSSFIRKKCEIKYENSITHTSGVLKTADSSGWLMLPFEIQTNDYSACQLIIDETWMGGSAAYNVFNIKYIDMNSRRTSRWNASNSMWESVY